MAVLPLLENPEAYVPCIQDLLADGESVRAYWLTLFERHVETLACLRVSGGRLDAQPAWPSFHRDYLAGLAELRREPAARGALTVLELTRYRDEKLAAHGFIDPFLDLKQRENRLAAEQLAEVLRDIDRTPWPKRGERLATGLFAGNLFDMGSRAAVDAFEGRGFDFAAARKRVAPRPWAVDDLDAWIERVSGPRPAYRQAIFFVDNAGPDIVLGALPLARALADGGICVALAANSEPALNDITAPELRGLLEELRTVDKRLDAHLREKRLMVVASGCASPLIDLSDVDPSCCAAAAESDLLILEGMGRAIESNYDTRFNVDTVKLALIKDPMVARVIGVRLFDPVFKFERA